MAGSELIKQYDLQKQFPIHFRDFNDNLFWDVDVAET